MSKYLYFFLLIFVIQSSFSQSKTSYLDKVCDLKNTSFKSGERIKYKIYYNLGLLWVPAGYAEFTVIEKNGKYIFKAIGKSFSSYNWFFKVDDYFTSVTDKNTLLPDAANRKINEGDYKIINDISFNQQKGTANSYTKINDKEGFNKKFNFEDCMLDILSLIYKLRNVDIKKLNLHDNVEFSIILDDEMYDLSLEYLGKCPKKEVNGHGKFNTFKISPKVIKGRVFDKEERMNIWISDDSAKVPLLIESPLMVGKIKVLIQDYENLVCPLNKA